MYEILKYIHENLHTNLELGEVAHRFGYSKWYFCEKFHKYTKRSFVHYIRHYRMQYAVYDILSGKSITDTAYTYGYETLNGFNKAFVAEFGCYPREFLNSTSARSASNERRYESMYQLSERCKSLRHIMMEDNPWEKRYCAQHAVYTGLGRAELLRKHASNTLVTGAGIANICEKFHPVIIPGELIVGFNFADLSADESFCPIDDTPESRTILASNGISAEEMEAFFDLKRHPVEGNPILMPEYTQADKDSEIEWASIGRCIDSNHTVLGFESVLRHGFSGLLAKAEKYEAKNGQNDMYTAIKQVCRAACGIGQKYAQEARRLRDIGDPAYQREDLDFIIETCSRIPAEPARSFREAVQSLLFAHIVNTWEDYINANSLGRLDQILYPYYKADLDAGILTKDEAFEIICCLWLKLYRSYDVQQSCVGGTAPDGTDQVNDLSYMMLDATEKLDFIRCLSVRYSQKTDHAFITRALEVVGHVGKGVPFFFNDDVMIPALESKGIPHKDACGYTQIGCVETVIPGKSNPHAVTGETNLLKALEYVLGNGHSMMYPSFCPGIETGALSSFVTFEQFYDAVRAQMFHILDLTCAKVKKWRTCSVTNSPKPVKSLLTEGCLESGRDFNDGGALYDYYQIMLGGIPNLADSLEVIREFVYNRQFYSLGEIKTILDENFPDETVRQEFINRAAKFGNDIDSVDSLAAMIINDCCDCLDTLSETYGLSFHAQPFTFLWMVDHGRESAASPDGRRRGEIIAYSLSPMQGRDFSGLTALLNSIAKMPTQRTPGTTSAIVEVDPKLFTDRNLPVLTEIFFASSACGLENVQFNTIDAQTLINAQKHPEKYNNLAVRVSGFSQKFNLLSPQLQDHIIGRTKHACL